MHAVIERLPEDNYEVLKFVVEFLVEVELLLVLQLIPERLHYTTVYELNM